MRKNVVSAVSVTPNARLTVSKRSSSSGGTARRASTLSMMVPSSAGAIPTVQPPLKVTVTLPWVRSITGLHGACVRSSCASAAAAQSSDARAMIVRACARFTCASFRSPLVRRRTRPSQLGLQRPQILANLFGARVLRSPCLLADRERALEQRLGLGGPALILVEQRQVVEADGDVGMLRSQHLLADRERALRERLRLGIAVLVAVDHRQIAQPGANVRMLRPQRLLAD